MRKSGRHRRVNTCDGLTTNRKGGAAMATSTLPPDAGGDNPHPPDIFAQLAGMVPVAVRIAMEADVDSVALEIRIRTSARRTHGLAQLLLSPNDAIDLAARLAGVVERWRAQQARDPEGRA
jgi:hypothetical protein